MGEQGSNKSSKNNSSTVNWLVVGWVGGWVFGWNGGRVGGWAGGWVGGEAFKTSMYARFVSVDVVSEKNQSPRWTSETLYSTVVGKDD